MVTLPSFKFYVRMALVFFRYLTTPKAPSSIFRFPVGVANPLSPEKGPMAWDLGVSTESNTLEPYLEYPGKKTGVEALIPRHVSSVSDSVGLLLAPNHALTAAAIKDRLSPTLY